MIMVSPGCARTTEAMTSAWPCVEKNTGVDFEKK